MNKKLFKVFSQMINERTLSIPLSIKNISFMIFRSLMVL